MTPQLIPIPESAPQLCTLEQVRERVGATSTEDDTKIERLIAAVTPTFCTRYGREFMPRTSVARVFEVRNRRVSLHPFDLHEVTAVVLHPGASSVTLTVDHDYMLGPIGSDCLTHTYDTIILAGDVSLQSDLFARFGVARLQVDGEWGIWASADDVPEDVNDAALITVLAWYDKPTSEIAILNGGDPRQMGPAAPAGWDIPFGAHRKLLPYSRELGVW